MKSTKIIVGISTITVIIAFLLLFFSPLKEQIISRIISFSQKGSIPQSKAEANICNTKDTVCVMQNGKIVSRKMTEKESNSLQHQFATEKELHLQYAQHVEAAVTAIRKYTQIPNLNVTLLKGSTPSHISYYCSIEKRCWAVDNQTHKVIPYEE